VSETGAEIDESVFACDRCGCDEVEDVTRGGGLVEDGVGAERPRFFGEGFEVEESREEIVKMIVGEATRSGREIAQDGCEFAGTNSALDLAANCVKELVVDGLEVRCE
jgi:hypothetical protein